MLTATYRSSNRPNCLPSPTKVDFTALYPEPVIRGARIARLGERYLGPIAIDKATGQVLGEQQIGWLIGGVPDFETMIEHVYRINQAAVGGRWIIVPATRNWAIAAYRWWSQRLDCSDVQDAPNLWSQKHVTFCLPEHLRNLARQIADPQPTPVAGILLLDPQCIVYRGRGFQTGSFRCAHDRPQLIVNFRSQLTIGNWSPPLLIMSCRAAAALHTTDITRVFGLEAMHFIEGRTLNCWGPLAYQRDPKHRLL